MTGWFGRRFPALLFGVGTLAILVALVRALLGPREGLYPMTVAMIAVYLLWVVCEAPTTFRTAASGASADDRGTELLYGAARMLTVAAALFGPVPWTAWRPWLVLPPLLLLGGIVLRLSAIRTLGRFYSHRARLLDGHRIVVSGPYRLVRHPAYAGMLLANAGTVLFFANPLSVAALIVLFIPAVIHRILVEERMMFTVPGYREFARRRKRLAPFVW